MRGVPRGGVADPGRRRSLGAGTQDGKTGQLRVKVVESGEDCFEVRGLGVVRGMD